MLGAKGEVKQRRHITKDYSERAVWSDAGQQQRKQTMPLADAYEHFEKYFMLDKFGSLAVCARDFTECTERRTASKFGA